jgi:hypothetical protein
MSTVESHRFVGCLPPLFSTAVQESLESLARRGIKTMSFAVISVHIGIPGTVH